PSSASAAARRRRSSPSTIATASRSRRTTFPGSSRSCAMAETTIGFEPPALVLADAIEAPLTDIGSYRAVGGYAQLELARAMSPHEVTDQLIQSNLRGRGGAFFPTGRKASFIPTPDKVAKPIYLTV